MGARANFVIVRQGIAAIYYDQWAALDCPILLANGPAEAAKFAESLEQVDGLMDAVWAEGGFLLDFDKKIAIGFGYVDVEVDVDEEGDLVVNFDDDEFETKEERQKAKKESKLALVFLKKGPEGYLKHIGRNWPGWSLSWDKPGGVAAFEDHLQRRGIHKVRPQGKRTPTRKKSPAKSPQSGG